MASRNILLIHRDIKTGGLEMQFPKMPPDIMGLTGVPLNWKHILWEKKWHQGDAAPEHNIDQGRRQLLPTASRHYNNTSIK